jgi:hypothetical protein
VALVLAAGPAQGRDAAAVQRAPVPDHEHPPPRGREQRVADGPVTGRHPGRSVLALTIMDDGLAAVVGGDAVAVLASARGSRSTSRLTPSAGVPGRCRSPRLSAGAMGGGCAGDSRGRPISGALASSRYGWSCRGPLGVDRGTDPSSSRSMHPPLRARLWPSISVVMPWPRPVRSFAEILRGPDGKSKSQRLGGPRRVKL